MFDQIAHPDGSNYPRLRQLIWGAIDQQASALTKQQQSQALSVLTYTTLVTAVACAAADALDIGRQEQGQQQEHLTPRSPELQVAYHARFVQRRAVQEVAARRPRLPRGQPEVVTGKQSSSRDTEDDDRGRLEGLPPGRLRREPRRGG